MVVVCEWLVVVVFCGDLGMFALLMDFKEVMLTSLPEMAHFAPPPATTDLKQGVLYLLLHEEGENYRGKIWEDYSGKRGEDYSGKEGEDYSGKEGEDYSGPSSPGTQYDNVLQFQWGTGDYIFKSEKVGQI